MTEADHTDIPATFEIPAVRDDEGRISADFLALVEAGIAAEDAAALIGLAGDLHEADVADLIEALPEDARVPLVRLLGDEFDYATLTELDEAVRLSILENLPSDTLAEGIGELDSDDAVYILEDLDAEGQAAILDQLPYSDRIQLQRSLDYPEESAGRLMQTDFIAVPPFWSVGQTIDHMRETEDLPDTFHEIFVVDPGFRLIGSVPLDKILRTKRATKISEIMTEDPQTFRATDDREDVARAFERYNLVSAAAVDEAGRLVGMLMIDDIVDVIQEEAEEDLRGLAGLGDEEISDTVLMPIVASMGGNAATQTMTVAVRALATRELTARNMLRVLRREVLVAFLNGMTLAVLLGTGATLWSGNPGLGVVIAMAIIINLFFAGVAGLLIPVALEKAGVDPAIASSVFVTTVTDVIGFFAFLGIAALWFGLPL